MLKRFVVLLVNTTRRNWYKRFRDGDFNVKDRERQRQKDEKLQYADQNLVQKKKGRLRIVQQVVQLLYLYK